MLKHTQIHTKIIEINMKQIPHKCIRRKGLDGKLKNAKVIVLIGRYVEDMAPD